MDEISEKQTAIEELTVTKETFLGVMSSQDSATVIDGLKEEIFKVIRDKIEIEMLDNARVAKTVNLELQVRQLTESLKISHKEKSLMRAKILKLLESTEEMARKHSALAKEKKKMEKTIKVLTEGRDRLCRNLENKQRELDEANRARYWVEQVKVNHECAIAWLQGELGRMKYVSDGLNASCKEFKDKNEQLLSQVAACMAKKMPSETGKEKAELNKVVRNKRSNNPTEEEEEVSSLRKKGKFEQSHSHVQGENNVVELESDRRPKEDNCSPLSSDASSDLVIIKYRAAVFHDFDKDRRREDCFTANQIWATYDSTDCLPRAYALVRKVASPFKLKITWLEPDPDDEGEMDWCDADLPTACGKFILGDSENVTNPVMFSHQIKCMKTSGEGSYLIYPKKGETWAIFRNWDIKWSSYPEGHLTDEFEYVEILSDFTQNVGIEVAYLVKVKGFVSLFQKAKKNGVNKFCILPNELYRFSHQIPSYKMTGNERKGVPSGCFELDTAALPTYLVRVDPELIQVTLKEIPNPGNMNRYEQ